MKSDTLATFWVSLGGTILFIIYPLLPLQAWARMIIIIAFGFTTASLWGIYEWAKKETIRRPLDHRLNRMTTLKLRRGIAEILVRQGGAVRQVTISQIVLLIKRLENEDGK